MRQMWHYGVAAILAGAAAQTLPAQSPAGTLKRWAVLSTPQIQDTGLADLITAELSGAGFELVERDQIKQVARELAFSQVLGSEGGSERLRLGQLLRADVLLILDVEEAAASPPTGLDHASQYSPSARDSQSEDPAMHHPAEPPSQPALPGHLMKVVISDCVQGSRLRVKHAPFDSSKPEQAAAAVRELAVWTREQFSGGIKCVVGVSNFVSRTLIHDYDHLQSSLACVLSNALSNVPGVAVIEVEEAQAIRQERATAEGLETTRLVPLLVEGEYRVVITQAGQSVIELKVRFSDGARTVNEFETKDLSIEATADHLRKEGLAWARKLTRNPANGSFSEEDQIRFMVNQADTFASLGSYGQSVGLREACLLLDPDVREQRLKLVHEYALLIRELWRPAMQMGSALDESTSDRILVLYTRGIGHVEKLIQMPDRHGQRRTNYAYSALAGSWQSWRPRWRSDLPPLRTNSRLFEAMESLKVRFLMEVLPKFKDEWRESLHPALLWASQAAAPISDGEWLPLELKQVADVLANVIPESEPFTHADVEYLNTLLPLRSLGIYRDSPRDEARRFVEAIEATGMHRNMLLARFLRLSIDGWAISHNQQGVPEVVLEEADRLLAECPEKQVALRKAIELVRHNLRKRAGVSETQPAPKPKRKKKPPPDLVGGIDKSAIPHAVAERITFNVIDALGRVHPVTEHPWNKTFHQTSSRVLSHMSCGELSDVFWNPQVVLLCDSPGLLKQLVARPRGGVEDVVWDGQCIWVGTRHREIIVVTPGSHNRIRIGQEQGLPPCDRALRLHPIEPGKVLAVGSFSTDDRAWCATVECRRNRVYVTVFHEATENPNNLFSEDAQSDHHRIRTRFRPSGIHPHPQPPAGQENTVFVTGREDRKLLEIDLKTLKVGLNNELYQLIRYSDAVFLLAQGIRLEVDDRRVIRRAPMGMTFSGGEAQYELPKETGPIYQPYAIPWGDYYYIPAHVWYRIHRQTGVAEPVNLKPLTPSEERSTRQRSGTQGQPNLFGRTGSILAAGLSAHYGLMIWSDDYEFARLSVMESDSRASDSIGLSLIPVSPPAMPEVSAYKPRPRQGTSPSEDRSTFFTSFGPLREWAFLPTLVTGAILLVIAIPGRRRRPAQCPSCSTALPSTRTMNCSVCGTVLTSTKRHPRGKTLALGTGLLVLGGVLAVPFVSELQLLGEGSPANELADETIADLLTYLTSPLDRGPASEALFDRIEQGGLSPTQLGEAVYGVQQVLAAHADDIPLRNEILCRITDLLETAPEHGETFESMLRSLFSSSAHVRFDAASGRLRLYGQAGFPRDDGTVLAHVYEVHHRSGAVPAGPLLEGPAFGTWQLVNDGRLQVDEAQESLHLRIVRKWVLGQASDLAVVKRQGGGPALSFRTILEESEDLVLERSDYRSALTQAYYWSTETVFAAGPSDEESPDG